MANNETTYEVNFTLTVDRPELRGPTYPDVAPGTKVRYTETFAKQGDAKRFMRTLADGTNTTWVCDSEFVTSCAGRALTDTHVRDFGGYRFIRRDGTFDQGGGGRARRRHPW